MAHRVRSHTTAGRDRDAQVSSLNSNFTGGGQPQQQQQHVSKRKRDVLQDISEEHAGNGSSSRQQALGGGSSRRVPAPRRPSPMAPVRRASVRVRRSRRLSEQPASNNGRGRLTTAASSSSAGNTGARGGSAGDRGAARERVAESSGEGDDGGMSCDEDLEGMVVDLSFEGVADDSAWRALPYRRQQFAPASTSTNRAVGAAANGNHVVDGGVGGGIGDKGASERGIDASEGKDRSDSSASGNNNSHLDIEVQADASQRGRASRIGRGGAGRDSHPRAAKGGSESGRNTRSSSQSSASTVEEELAQAALPRGPPPRGHISGNDDLEIKEAPKTSGSSYARLAGGSSKDAKPEAAEARAAAIDKRLSEDRSILAAGARTPLPAGVEDIDAAVMDEAESHLQNAEYSVEHAAFLRIQERRNRPVPYIGMKQKDMRQHMRSVLVDWIVEVCDQFKLSSRTLFQVVELIDRSLSAFEVARGKLQLLGCSCVVLASKYEEIYAPTAEELAHISDNTYTRAEIISMELVVVNALQFRLTCITPCCFVDRFCRAAKSNPRERSLVCYLLELLLQDYTGVSLLPSLKAAAALYLARQTMHPRGCPREAWPKQTEYCTGYSPRVLEPCVRRLHALHLRAEGHNLHVVRDKYKRSQWHRVAELTCAVEDSLYFGSDEE